MSLLDIKHESEHIHERLKDFQIELESIRKLESYQIDYELKKSVENMLDDLEEIIEG